MVESKGRVIKGCIVVQRKNRRCIPTASRELYQGIIKGAEDVVSVEYRDRGNSLLKATDNLTLTFAGSAVSQVITLGFKQHTVLFIYREAMQCYKCYGYEHKNVRCTAKEPVCGLCGTSEHINKDCQANTVPMRELPRRT